MPAGLIKIIFFSIVQRKALTPNDFTDLDTLERRLLAFGRRYEQIAAPFEWKFTRADLDRIAERLDRSAAEAAQLEYVGEFPSQSTTASRGTSTCTSPTVSRRPP